MKIIEEMIKHGFTLEMSKSVHHQNIRKGIRVQNIDKDPLRPIICCKQIMIKKILQR